MSELNSHDGFGSPVPSHRLDVPIHNLLNQSAPRPAVQRTSEGKTLPEPVFPQHPELLHELDEADIAAHQTVLRTGKREWGAAKILDNMRGWMFPYFKSRLLPATFIPSSLICLRSGNATSIVTIAGPSIIASRE